MTFTYDLNANGFLKIKCDLHEGEMLKELADSSGDGSFDCNAEYDALESLMADSELHWIYPEEMGALTDAPILGLRDENGKPTAAWGFMDYQIRSFIQDLIDKGEAIFVGGVV